ncbi:MAG: LuxR family transcriptional regulator [Armatimonadota bacterium]|nr:LuxR family transcriptional regulator [Armatimonadota bacterium]
MQTKETPSYLRTHRLRGKVMQFALGAEDSDLRKRAATSKSGRAAKTLVKEGVFRITIVALTKGTALQSHEVAGPVSIQSIRGCLRVTTEAGDVDVPAGSLVALDAGVAHSARALDDCATLVTVAIG